MWIFETKDGRHTWRFVAGGSGDVASEAVADFERLSNPNVTDRIFRAQMMHENGFVPPTDPVSDSDDESENLVIVNVDDNTNTEGSEDGTGDDVANEIAKEIVEKVVEETATLADDNNNDKGKEAAEDNNNDNNDNNSNNNNNKKGGKKKKKLSRRQKKKLQEAGGQDADGNNNNNENNNNDDDNDDDDDKEADSMVIVDSIDATHKESEVTTTTTTEKSKTKGKKTKRSEKGGAALALDKASKYFTALQCADGHWGGDYGGPMFLLPGLLVAARIAGLLPSSFDDPEPFALARDGRGEPPCLSVGPGGGFNIPDGKGECTVFGTAERAAMIAYLRHTQDEDGGWGLHIESRSTMFGTVLNYIALRLLGCPADDPDATRAREWIRKRGGAISCPSWGKFWMCLLGVHDYEGINPVCPDLWLLPDWFPVFHPGRMWCHSRMVYLPMGYLYGHRVVGPVDDLVLSLRSELYVTDYSSIKWTSVRDSVYEADVFHPHHWSLDILHKGLGLWEKIVPKKIRDPALEEAWVQIQREDDWTNYYSIGPVNKMLNMVCHWHHGNTDGVVKHLRQIEAYMWVSEDGMKMSGQVGSQCWDTAFTVCALKETGLAPKFPETIRRAGTFIDGAQMQKDMPDRGRYYRSGTKGAWPFTVGAHGWAISDCTAEGFSAALALRTEESVDESSRVSRERLQWTVDLLLEEQNPSGGWSSYERQRGGDWYELINPSEVFGKIMTDYQYVECTSSSVMSLRHFQEQFPDYRSDEINAACRRAIDFIESRQRSDGSFYGSWAVCFTYGAWFAIRGLVAAGVDPTKSIVVEKACKFLLAKQRRDGGWGEAFASCETGAYIEAPTSQVVNTAWAVIALMAAQWPDRRPIDNAIRFLVSAQKEDGNFAQDVISGVFNGSCAITYANYANIFPMWALGLFVKNYGGRFADDDISTALGEEGNEGDADWQKV